MRSPLQRLLSLAVLAVVPVVPSLLVPAAVSAQQTGPNSAPTVGNQVPEDPWWWHQPPPPPQPITTISITGDVLFETGSSTLSPSATSQLAGVLTLAQQEPTAEILVEGFTDSDGTPAYNQVLSEQRAGGVSGWLAAQGVAPDRLTAIGHGEADPVAPNDTPDHKAQNRRVVITVKQLGS